MRSRSAWWFPFLLAGCDPIWNARVTLHDPAHQPVPQASVALDCARNARLKQLERTVMSDAAGKASVGGMGTQFPVDCDVVITKAGFQPFTIAYRDLCPNGPKGCDRVFERAVVLQQQQPPQEAAPQD
ncbi:MAG: carboxypeptidase regulatory-like domain-containing protein [Deltaproteobacteria bacterium]|nr:carboxypeptidase regulatory-like domain-containing protein [Deltaproteobacteria bacterium]